MTQVDSAIYAMGAIFAGPTADGTNGQVLVTNGSKQLSFTTIVSGVSALNSLTGSLSIAVGTSGSDVAVSASGSTVTVNIPDAGASARGVLTTGTQTIAGAKTFNTNVIVANASNAVVPLTCSLAASQSADAVQVKNSSGTVLTSILPGGGLHIKASDLYRGILIDAVNGSGANASLTFFNGAAAYGTIGLQGTVMTITTSAYTNVSTAAAYVNGLAYFSSDTNLYGSGEANAEIAVGQGHAAFHALSRGAASSTDYGLLLTGGVTYVGNQTMLALNGAAVFNEAGNDADFRVEGDTDANLIFADASADAVCIGSGTPTGKLTIQSPASHSVPPLVIREISSTPAEREQFAIDTAWIDSTDATRKARVTLNAYDTATREFARGWADGSKGRFAITTPASAPTDAHLAASQISFYLDESGHNLIVRVKYADGTTLKTATIALV